MRHCPKVLVTLIASAALLVPAALAGADSQTASKSTPAPSSSLSCWGVCFDILNDNDIKVLNNLDIAAVLNICPSVELVELNALWANGGVISCSGSTNPQHKKIKPHH